MAMPDWIKSQLMDPLTSEKDRQHYLDVMKMAMIGQGGGAGGIAINWPVNSIADSDTSSEKLGKMIDMRLRTPAGKFRFEFMMCHKAKNADKVLVFIYHKDQHTVLEDTWGLFPSDALVTQLRMIID